MSAETWSAVDHYLGGLFIPPDSALEAALESSRDAAMPAHQVSPAQGKLLHVLARSNRAKNILEIGTLGGYSAIWLARALPANGGLITLEIESKHVEVAFANIARAGLNEIVEIRLGPALDSLEALASEKLAPFDLVFIDADKQNNPRYFEWAMKLAHPGSLIVVDNVVRSGDVLDTNSTDPDVIGTRAVLELMSKEPRLSATAIQSVGEKGHDGFAIGIVDS